MKKFKIAILLCIILCISIFFIEFNLCKLTYNKNIEESEEILKIAHSMIGEKNESNILNNYLDTVSDIDFISDTDIINDMNIIGILVIPKLQIEAPIKEGTSQNVMKTSIGHFTESDYWDGNVSFASHNSGTSVHYFEKINTLNVGDEIEYITKLGTRKYKVQSVKQIESTDWSMVVKNNQVEDEKNTITLITCINGKSNYRLCVRGVEV